MLVIPTIAQEGLGRTAVEAMACGRPVIASRIGGLPATVLDGATGLLFEPEDAADLAHKLKKSADDGDLRLRLGCAVGLVSRNTIAWPVIIEKHYRPLLVPIGDQSSSTAIRSTFTPILRERTDQAKLQDSVAALLGLTTAQTMGLFRGYRALHDRERYAERSANTKRRASRKPLFCMRSCQRGGRRLWSNWAHNSENPRGD